MPGLITHTRTYLLFAILGIVTMLAAGTAAKAQSVFDGLWSVQIVAQAGACGSGSVTYSVMIVGGVVQYAGAIAGRVDRQGDIRVSIASGAGRANATGRLSGINGSGRWVSPIRGCSGYWTAVRQG